MIIILGGKKAVADGNRFLPPINSAVVVYARKVTQTVRSIRIETWDKCFRYVGRWDRCDSDFRVVYYVKWINRLGVRFCCIRTDTE